jgi:hypothetical protein
MAIEVGAAVAREMEKKVKLSDSTTDTEKVNHDGHANNHRSKMLTFCCYLN